jgi:Ca2+:H+ antiporter
VGLAELLSPAIEAGMKAAGASKTIVGIAIAMLVMLPEDFAAVGAARANQLHSSLNLALGISSLNMTLIYLNFFVGVLTLAISRTTKSQDVDYIIIFFEYLFLSLLIKLEDVLGNPMHLT